MGIFKGSLKIDTSDIDSKLKKSEKRLKRSSKLFGSTDKQEKRYLNLPGIREKAKEKDSKIDVENLASINKMDNNDSLKLALSGLEESNEESLELEKTSVKSRNPLNLLKEVNDKRKLAVELLEDKAFEAGKLTAIFSGIRDLFRKQAKKYIREHKQDNSYENFAEAAMSAKEIAGDLGSDIFQSIIDKKRGNSSAQLGLENTFKKAFDYITFKSACFLANEDVPEIKTNIENKTAELVGANSNLYPTDLIGGQADHAKRIIYDVYSSRMYTLEKFDSETFKLLTNISNYATYDINKGILKFDDVMEFYKKIYLIDSEERDPATLNALEYVLGDKHENNGLITSGIPVYNYNEGINSLIFENISKSKIPHVSVDPNYKPLLIKSYPIRTNKPVITSPFGKRRDPKAIQMGLNAAIQFHNGIDIADSSSSIAGANIYCVSDGTVVRTNYSNVYGNYVMVDHENGYLTLYAHMEKVKVYNGNKVKGGDILGLVGTTGASTGYHLHFSIMHMTPDEYAKERINIRSGKHQAIAKYNPINPEYFIKY